MDPARKARLPETQVHALHEIMPHAISSTSLTSEESYTVKD
jgi:hypothetical protein